MSTVLSVEELQVLVAAICNPATDQNTRVSAEKRLQELQNEPGSWWAHVQLLQSVEDTLLFFLCLGLQRIVWKHWNSMNVADHECIVNALVNLLATKSQSLPLFARSKAELVLAACCINSYSFQPVLSMIESTNEHAVIAGMSALRTVLEEVYAIDDRISPSSREVLMKAANEIIAPATVLACTVCQSCLQNPSLSMASLHVAVSLLKVIVGKAEIGPHITPDVLNMLFNIAHLGATPQAAQYPSYTEASVRAVGVLTDLMSRRYLPRGVISQSPLKSTTPSPHLPMSPGSLARAGPGAGREGSRSPVPASLTPQAIAAKDVGAEVLVDLVVKAITLLKEYRSVGDVDESPVVLPLLEFITTFSDFQLERCLMSPSSGMAANISAFLREIASLSCASMEPKYLAKIAYVWENLLALEAVFDHLVSQLGDSVCAVIANHLLCTSLASVNPNLRAIQDDMEDDIQLDTFADPRIRELVGHLSSPTGSGSQGNNGFLSSKDNTETGVDSMIGQPENAEELSSDGSALRLLTTSVLQMLTPCPEVRTLLTSKLGEMLEKSLGLLSTASGSSARSAALDTCFLVQLMPTVNPPDALIANYSMLLLQLMNARIYSHGKPFVAVIVTLANAVARLVPSARTSSFASSSSSSAMQAGPDPGLVKLASNLPCMLQIVAAACDTMISPAPFAVAMSSSAMLLVTVSELSGCLDRGQLPEAVELTKQGLGPVMGRLGSLPLEVQALLICVANTVMPEIASQLTEQLHALCASICSTEVSPINSPGKVQLTNPNVLNNLNRYCGSLGALAKHHAVGCSPNKRQMFIAAVAPLQVCLIPLLGHSFQQLGLIASGAGSPNGSSLNLLLQSIHMNVALVSGLLSSLGKKAFGQVSVLALSCCATFLQSEAREVLCSSYGGLSVLRQVLQLVIEVATSSSAVSSASAQQINLTAGIIAFVTSHFTDPRICAELLQPTIKAGTVSMACYWKHRTLRRGHGGGIVTATTVPATPSPDIDGESGDVLPIATLLVQLFAGSMDPSVSPHEAQDAIDGIQFLINEHNVFSTGWFQSGGCWEGVAAAVIRALLLQAHPTLQEGLCEIFDALVKSTIVQATPALAQGVWQYIAGEVFRCANESGYGERAAHLMNSLVAKYADTSRIDAAVFVQEVVQPLAVYIAKSKD